VIDVIKKVDGTFGWALCQLFRRKKTEVNGSVSAVAFIQLWGLGESLLTLPAIEQYSKKHSEARICVVCTGRNVDVYSRCEFVDEVLRCPLNPLKIVWFALKNFRKFDLVFDFEEYLNISALIALCIGSQSVGFQHGARAHTYNQIVRYDDAQYVAKTFCDLVGEPFKGLVRLPISHEDKLRAGMFLVNNNISKRPVLLFPWTAESAPWRAWPMQNWAGLIKTLKEDGEDVVVVLGPLDDNNIFGGSIAFSGSVWELAALIEKSKCFITNDTGPMHVAYVHGCKTVCLFGPNIPARWFPYLKHTKLVFHKQACCPCIDSKTGVMTVCEHDSKCMNEITVKEVINEVSK